MTKPTPSYEKVSYDLRPAKQVERRMIIDTLQILAGAGFQIRDYQYTGLGSIYFVDFILFHKLLGIKKLLSVEINKSIKKRVHFNQPFNPVDIELKPIGDIIPTLDPDLKHLLWLDYDFRLNKVVVEDTALAAYHLSPGSILLITIDVKPPTPNDDPQEWKDYYEEQAERFFDYNWTVDNFTPTSLPMTAAKILFNTIRNGISLRPNRRFLHLFNFLYADGHPMLTIGGMIGTSTEEHMLNGAEFSDACYLRRDPGRPPFEIIVPKLTRKERLYVDTYMPCKDNWKPKDFELKKSEIMAYREIYRYYPAYAELLL